MTAETFLNGKVALLAGDMLAVLPTLAENSIDSCVTDPPYHLTSIVQRFGADDAVPAKSNGTGVYARSSAGFMGKKWDGGDIAFQPETWAEVYRVLKPGGHLLAFGGDRTIHRMTCAIEDAGFEIRRQLGWIFGSGFPKSKNISAALMDSLPVDALCACVPDCRRTTPNSLDDCPSYRGSDDGQLRMGQAFDPSVLPLRADVPAHSHDGLLLGAPAEEQANISLGVENDHLSTEHSVARDIRRPADYRSGDNALSDNQASTLRSGLTAAHKTASRKSHIGRLVDDWGVSTLRNANLSQCLGCGKIIVESGLGTDLKPAMELIVMARKPLSEPTVAANVLRWGTGALNIDGCRVAIVGDRRDPCGADGKQHRTTGGVYGEHKQNEGFDLSKGRWPANLVHDGSDEVVEVFPDSGNNWRANKGGGMGYHGGNGDDRLDAGHHDSGSAARFFYTAKADADDRIGSKHPTIKPVDLMQWLIRLVTPRDGVVLDPFAGTGTTGEAAWREGCKATLIEREEDSLADIRRRMALALAGPNERKRAIVAAGGKLDLDPGPLFASLTQRT